MPIVGVIDPSHDERKSDGPGRLPTWYPKEEVLAQALSAHPRWSPWSYELLNAAINELEERGDNISSTALVNACPRSLVLERKEPYVVDMDKLWRAFRGTMVHYVLEGSARPGSVAEVRFFANLGPRGSMPVSCKPDLVTPDGIMWDYKNTREVPRYDYVYSSHNFQLQFNRWIVNNATNWEKDEGITYDLPFNPHALTFKHLAIMYMDIDGPKPLEVLQSIKVPTKSGGGTRSQRVPFVWTDEQVMEEMLPRYQAVRLALDSYPDFPDELAEVWGGDPTWKCPGYPWCKLRGMCLASKYPKGLIW